MSDGGRQHQPFDLTTPITRSAWGRYWLASVELEKASAKAK